MSYNHTEQEAVDIALRAVPAIQGNLNVLPWTEVPFNFKLVSSLIGLATGRDQAPRKGAVGDVWLCGMDVVQDLRTMDRLRHFRGEQHPLSDYTDQTSLSRWAGVGSPASVCSKMFGLNIVYSCNMPDNMIILLSDTPDDQLGYWHLGAKICVLKTDEASSGPIH